MKDYKGETELHEMTKYNQSFDCDTCDEVVDFVKEKLRELIYTKKGKVALAAVAVGAFAVGAMAYGVMAIGKLAVGDAHIGSLKVDRMEIDHLKVRTLEVEEQI